ncbi:MAG TPA: DUF3160 domain-containing protein [bacterium]|nr:DUF3160 domain-containing protein [bacterium]
MSDNLKRILIAVIGIILIVAIFASIFFVFKNKKNKKVSEPVDIATSTDNETSDNLGDLIESSRLIGGLPTSDEKIGVNFSGSKDNNLIEYVSFFDYYKPITDNLNLNLPNYSLPFNIKTEVVNYYDFSRKINLDSSINSLNTDGFAVVNNSLSSNNFYSIYDELYKKQIPLLITSDFLVYYYQQILKETFKDVEKNIFYSNLWDINEYLYEKANNRYGETLKITGDVNDRVLEAQRLTAAYFAVSLELLKPDSKQINSKNDINNKTLFTPFEAEDYSFIVPDYLKVDVDKEVALIKKAKSLSKSPVLLYDRDYKDFVIPDEYKNNAKLNNFYLATEWLSSNFPLYYQSEECRDCSLDFDDWRISIISSSYIAQDIFNNYELKNNWARIYKTLAFFKGLRGDLTYVHYRDALTSLFGDNYKIEEIFSDNNTESVNNLYKLRNKVLEYNFLDIEGGIDKQTKNKLGVKMLTDFYWPNDYIFNTLSYPNVSNYQGDNLNNNITYCKINDINQRCNGFSLDVLALVNKDSVNNNSYYLENSNYNNYNKALDSLKSQISQFSNIWHYNNYWETLSLIKEYLINDKSKMPTYAQNANWQKQELYSAVSFWANLQLPVDNLSVYQKYQDQSIVSGDNEFINYNYIEPNLSLINEQLANVNMIMEMFKLLKITDELKSTLLDLEELKNNLIQIKEIMIKELNSEELSTEDIKFISLFSRAYKLDSAGNKVLEIRGSNNKTIKYDISSLKLKIIVSKFNNQKALSIGPTFSYIESR